MKKSPHIKALQEPPAMKATEAEDDDAYLDNDSEGIRIIFFGDKEKRGGAWRSRDVVSGKMLGKERREVKREARRVEKIWEALKKRKGG